MHIALFGTSAESVAIFEELRTKTNACIALVITPPDSPAGRRKKLAPCPVAQWAHEHSLSLLQPEKPNTEIIQELKEKNIDLGIVVSYGRLFSQEFLTSSPPLWNVHYSLLPKFRGASPVASAILAGESRSGVSIFEIQKGLDDGPILAQESIDIQDKRSDVIFTEMNSKASTLLVNILSKYTLPKGKEQDHQNATYCHKIQKSAGKIDPSSETASQILKKIRAYFPWPSVFFIQEGKIIKLHNALLSEKRVPAGTLLCNEQTVLLGCAKKTTLEITEIQQEGKKKMNGNNFARGQQGEREKQKTHKKI